MITPRAKAENLIELFTFSCTECDNARLSALKCAEECLAIIRNEYSDTTEAVQYWMKVKNILEFI